MTDRSILKLARVEYLRRASLLDSTVEETKSTSETTPAPKLRARARKTRVRNPKSLARRQVKRLLARNEQVPPQLLKAGWPDGKARKPEVQRLLESTGLTLERKIGPVRGRKGR